MNSPVAVSRCAAQESSHKYRLVVNTLGEIIRVKNCEEICIGGVNLTEAAELLSPNDREKWRELAVSKGETSEEMDRLIDTLYDKSLRKHLTPAEAATVKRIWDLQNLNTDRFRIYGGRTEKRREWLILVTEFNGFKDDVDFWIKLGTIAGILGASINTMFEGKHVNQWKHKDDKKWTTGPNHGRMERQVELAFDVLPLNKPAIRELIDRVAKETETLWRSHGISVG